MCSAVYPEALYIIQGILESIISLLILFLLKSVHLYVQKWENSELEKRMPKKMNNLSDY
jgi:hypothetical protein